MTRPQNYRRIGWRPICRFFKPQGIPLSMLEEIVLTDDELEAVRLADVKGLYQEQAAEHMGVSRQTFGRIIESAHKKIGEALVHGKALCIEGGNVMHVESPASSDDQGFGSCRNRRRRHSQSGEQKP